MRARAFLLALLFFGAAAAQTPPRVGPLQIQNNLGEIAAGGAAAQAAAQANLGTATNLSGANASGANVTATGAVTARTLADRAAERLNIKDYGAVGDTNSDQTTATIALGSAALTVGHSDFTAADVGKAISVDGAGTQAATGAVSSIPTNTAGSGYVSLPTITLGSIGSGTLATPLPRMALQSGTVASGGVGCTTGTQTFTLSGGSPITVATLTGTVTAGVLSGALTVTAASSYINLPTPVATVPLTGGGCSTPPTLNASFGLLSVYMAGSGINYPPGVTASISGGTPSVAAALGTPVVTLPTPPLVTTIAGVTSPTQITLAATAATALTGGAVNIAWGHDDSAAINATVIQANTFVAAGGFRKNLYFPSGNYWVQSAPPMLSGNVGITGDGVNISKLTVSPAFTGDLFSWSDAWIGNSGSTGGTTIQAGAKSGVNITGIHVVGNRLSANIQNAFVFYDHTDFLIMDRVQVETLHGRALYAGIVKNDAESYIRESHFSNFRMFSDGAPGFPVFELSSNAPGDSSNTIELTGIDIYAPYDVGIFIHGQQNAPRGIFGDYIRIEGVEVGGVGADLLKLGDATNNTIMQSVMFSHLDLLDCYQGFAAVHLTSPGPSFVPYGMQLSGVIGGGVPYGRGLQLDFSRASSYAFQLISTSDINVTIGANSSNNLITGWGQEKTWSYSLDAASLASTLYPALANGSPGGAGLDLQLSRTSSTQVASGAASFAAGSGNTASGQYSVAFGGGNAATNTGSGAFGNANNVSGSFSFGFGQSNSVSNGTAMAFGFGNTVSGASAEAFGFSNRAAGTGSDVFGQGAYDHGRYGWFGYGNHNFLAQGDDQSGVQPMSAVTAGAAQATLSADGGAVNTVNILNLPNNSSYGFGRISVVAFDKVGIQAAMWYVDGLLATRGASAATTALIGTPTVTLAQSNITSIVAGSLVISADTTNGGILFKVTGISAALHVATAPVSVEVQ